MESGQLSFGHARALLALEIAGADDGGGGQGDGAGDVGAADRDLCAGADRIRRSKPKAKKTAAEAVDPNVREAQERLQRRLGLRVRIEDKKGKGRVIIEYAGVEDFDAILGAGEWSDEE